MYSIIEMERAKGIPEQVNLKQVTWLQKKEPPQINYLSEWGDPLN